jgi:uncharacterized protein (UPF0305 family)
MLKLILKRSVRSGLIGGKKFEVAARVESERDLSVLFKGYPDELVMAFKSAFVDRSTSMKRSDLVKGTRFSTASLNEMIELEDRLLTAFDQLKRMVAIIETVDTDVAFEG